QAEDGIRDFHVTGVQTCALPILPLARMARSTALPLTSSALEFGKRAWMLGGRPTWRALSKSSAYAMEVSFRGGLGAPLGILSNRSEERGVGTEGSGGAAAAVSTG